MAQNNRQSLIFEITGDESGLSRALKNAANELGSFGDRAGGSLGGLNTGLSVTAKAVGSLAGAVGVAGVAIAATLAKVQIQSEKAFETFQAASLSQMGIEQIQQMANMYAKVGLSMENISDQQKDLKDRIGDALTNQAGSMYTDVIQPLKLNVLELQKMADAGEDVYAKIYFAAKAQGLSASQMVNMFETMGSDATKRLTVLSEYNNEQEYNNSLATQQVQLTTEQSKQFGEYRQATIALSNAWESWENNALAPIAGRLAGIINQIATILASKDKMLNIATGGALLQGSQVLEDEKNLQEVRKKYSKEEVEQRIKYGNLIVHTDEEIAAARKKVEDDSAKQTADDTKKQITGYSKGTLDAAMQPFESAKDKVNAQIEQLERQRDDVIAGIKASPDLFKDAVEQQKQIDTVLDSSKAKIAALEKSRDASDTAAAKAAESKSAAEAKAADAAQKQADAKRIQAQKSLDQTLAAIGQSSAQTQVQTFNLQQNEIEKRIETTSKTLGKSAQDVTDMLKLQYANRTRLFKEMVDSMLAESDPTKLSQNIVAITQSTDASTQDKAKAAQAAGTMKQNLSSQGLGYTDPTSFSVPQTATDSLNKETQDNQDAQKTLYDGGIIDYQQYQDNLSSIAENAEIKRNRLQAQYASSTTALWQKGAGDIGTVMSAAFGESSAAAHVAFGVQKGIAIATAMLNISQGMSEAIKLGWPMGLAAGLQVAAQGAQLVSTIKGTNIQGQAHDGWDSLPSTGTYNLEKGERVVGKSLNQDLTSYLSNGGDSSNGSNITIEAPLIIQNSGELKDSDFQQMCDKHADTIVQAVRKSQKQNV